MHSLRTDQEEFRLLCYRSRCPKRYFKLAACHPVAVSSAAAMLAAIPQTGWIGAAAEPSEYHFAKRRRFLRDSSA